MKRDLFSHESKNRLESAEKNQKVLVVEYMAARVQKRDWYYSITYIAAGS